jgi:hypothetical protein
MSVEKDSMLSQKHKVMEEMNTKSKIIKENEENINKAKIETSKVNEENVNKNKNEDSRNTNTNLAKNVSKQEDQPKSVSKQEDLNVNIPKITNNKKRKNVVFHSDPNSVLDNVINKSINIPKTPLEKSKDKEEKEKLNKDTTTKSSSSDTIKSPKKIETRSFSIGSYIGTYTPPVNSPLDKFLDEKAKQAKPVPEMNKMSADKAYLDTNYNRLFRIKNDNFVDSFLIQIRDISKTSKMENKERIIERIKPVLEKSKASIEQGQIIYKGKFYAYSYGVFNRIYNFDKKEEIVWDPDVKLIIKSANISLDQDIIKELEK